MSLRLTYRVPWVTLTTAKGSVPSPLAFLPRPFMTVVSGILCDASGRLPRLDTEVWDLRINVSLRSGGRRVLSDEIPMMVRKSALG